MDRVIYQKYRSLIIDIIVAALCFLSLFMYCYLDSSDLAYSLLYSATLTSYSPIVLLIIHFVPDKGKDDLRIYESKAAIFPFVIIQPILIMIILISRRYFGIYSEFSQKVSSIIVISLKVFLTSTILISYFFKIKFKFFHWNIRLKEFFLIIAIYILSILCRKGDLIAHGMVNLNSLVEPSLIASFSIQLIRQSLYPALFEELLYRGLLISGLKGLGFKDETTNIIQAVIFGITHVISFGNVPLVFILHTATQIILGYVLGKVYFKTKSLTPCILLHGLFDIPI